MPEQHPDIILPVPSTASTPSKRVVGAKKGVRKAATSSSRSPPKQTAAGKTSNKKDRKATDNAASPARPMCTLDDWVVRDVPTPTPGRSPLRSLSPDVPIGREAPTRVRPSVSTPTPPTNLHKRSRSEKKLMARVVELDGSPSSSSDPAAVSTAGKEANTAAATVTPPGGSSRGRRSSPVKVSSSPVMDAVSVHEQQQPRTPVTATRPHQKKLKTAEGDGKSSSGSRGRKSAPSSASSSSCSTSLATNKKAAARGMDTFTRKGVQQAKMRSKSTKKGGRGGASTAAQQPTASGKNVGGETRTEAVIDPTAAIAVAEAASEATTAATTPVASAAAPTSRCRAGRPRVNKAASEANAPADKDGPLAAVGEVTAATRNPLAPCRALPIAGKPGASPLPAAATPAVADAINGTVKPAVTAAGGGSSGSKVSSSRKRKNAEPVAAPVRRAGPLVVGAGGGSGWKKKETADAESKKKKIAAAGSKKETIVAELKKTKTDHELKEKEPDAAINSSEKTETDEAGSKNSTAGNQGTPAQDVAPQVVPSAVQENAQEQSGGLAASPSCAAKETTDRAPVCVDETGGKGIDCSCKRPIVEDETAVADAATGSPADGAKATSPKKRKKAAPTSGPGDAKRNDAASAPAEAAAALSSTVKDREPSTKVDPVPEKNNKRKGGPSSKEETVAKMGLAAAGTSMLEEDTGTGEEPTPAGAAAVSVPNKKSKAAPDDGLSVSPATVVASDATSPVAVVAVAAAAAAAVPTSSAVTPEIVGAGATPVAPPSNASALGGAFSNTGTPKAVDTMTTVASAGGLGWAPPGVAGGRAAVAPAEAPAPQREAEVDTHVMVGEGECFCGAFFGLGRGHGRICSCRRHWFGWP